MKNITFLLFFLVLFSSCPEEDIATPIEGPAVIAWSEQASIPGSSRINASAIIHNNEAYLMPGKGGSRFSLESEILKYSNNAWTDVSTYDGWAEAGSYGAWRNDDLIYLVGGLNGSGAPTDEVRSFSLTSNDFNDATQIPSGNRASSSSCYSQTKGYIGYGFGFNPDFQVENEIWSYDFTSGAWDSIPIPPVSQVVNFSLMTCENNSVYILFPALESANFYRLDEGAQEWVSLPNFPGGARVSSVIISTEDNIYTGLGRTVASDGFIYDDIWEYDIEENEWIEFSQYPGTPFHSGFAFELNNDFYFGGGSTEIAITNSSLNNEVHQMTVNYRLAH